jgi:hypothetical protein
MKKITLLFLFLSVLSVTEMFSQSDYYTCIPSDGSTSGNARAPHGRFRYQRGVALIKATEMTASGIVNGDVINSIAFNYLTAQDIPTNATLTLYLQNTSDATNLKNTTWATAITGMTTVSTGAITIPAAAGNVIFNFTGGSPFTYTGGGVYVAFDYQNATNPLPTVFTTVDCNSTGLTGGFKGAQSDTAVQTTIAASNFRPVILLGKSVSCARPVNLGFNTPTLNSAILTFNATSGGTVDLEYGPYNYTQGTGGTLVTNITSPYTLTGLTPSTTYDFYVRKNCGGSYSSWAGPYPFHTLFEPTIPTYNTGFEQEDFPYIGWLANPDNTANSWFINFGGTGSPLVQEGIASAIAITPTAAAASESLYSRGVNLTEGSSVTITYYDRNYVNTTAPVSTNTASYLLTVGTTQEATSQTTVLNSTTGLSTSTFTLRTVNYTTPSTGTYYFRFQNTSPANATGTHALIIDNFTVTETLGVNEFLNSKFALYPNPTTGIVNLSNTIDATINSVEILDLNGRLINNVKVNSDNQVNISELSKGIYMMKIISDEGTAIKKVIKE